MTWQRQGVIYEGINSRAQVPVVDTNNDGFWRIYFSHRDLNNHSYTSYIDVEPGNPKNIIKECSAPVLSPGPLGSVDQAGAMASSIVTINNLKLMYYVGWSQRKDVAYFNTTCVAYSENGEEWTKLGPILGPDLKDPGYSGTFHMVANRSNTEYSGLYLSCFEWKDGEPRYNLRVATSFDGITWKKQGVGIDITEQEGGVSQASTLYNAFNGLWRTWYSKRDHKDYRTNPLHSYRIKYAETHNLHTWEVFDSDNDLYPTNNPNDWDGIMCCYPCVVEYQGTLFMFYNGNGFGQTGIGYATWT